MAKVTVTLENLLDASTLQEMIPTVGRAEAAQGVVRVIRGMEAGAQDGKMTIAIAPVAASGTITFTGVGQALDTILVNGVTFTARASGATGNEWNVGASATLSAAALAAAINASATALVNTQVTASSLGAVVTVTAAALGFAGNAVTIAEGVDATSAMTVSGARLTGGTATSVVCNFGL